MLEPIYITGCGIISSIGVGKRDTLHSLLNKKSGIGKMRFLNSIHKEIPVGEVQMSNREMAQLLGIEMEDALSRSVLLGRIALKEALNDAHIESEQLPNVHFISATTVADMDRREIYRNNEGECNEYYAKIATKNCGSCTYEIASYFGTFAFISTISTACSAATNAIIAGADMLRSHVADIVVVGGTEALSLFHLNGFNSLMILDSEQCKPFDKNRSGLNLGEGAAYLVMEREESFTKRGVTPIAILSGYGNACDAFHQTASSPQGTGAYLAMNEALQMAGLKPCQIDYINAHGTATLNNDESETEAIKRIFGENPPPFSSTKSFTGHTTSASGSIEAVICLLALNEQFIPVNLNFKTQMESGLVPYLQGDSQKNIEHILSNAFGFGGNDSTIIISKYQK